jgi:rod shape-determining protein MreD
MGVPWRLVCAVMLAVVLSILPLPPYLQLIRPAWVLLLILYIQAYLPDYFHALGVLFLGLCLDVLLVTPMGEHAFALIIITWLMMSIMKRCVFYATIQQMLIVGLGCWGYQFILYIADGSLGYPSSLVPVSGVAVTSMLCWPLLLKIKLLPTEQRRYARS